MVAVQENFPRFTPEEYFEWEEKQELRYEYLGGEVYAMSGGTVNHGQIAINFAIILGTHLSQSKCRVLSSDVKVEVQKSTKFIYPDLSVTCDDRDENASNFISHPCLIVEILSPSTEGYDRGEKFYLYERSNSLKDYVLVNTNKIEINLYKKDDLGKWQIIKYVAGELVELESINLSFPIEEVFRSIKF